MLYSFVPNSMSEREGSVGSYLSFDTIENITA